MRFSDTLFAITEDLWKEALDKPFVKKMADGSLEKHLYANYMLQDYLYLQDYVEILKRILSMVEDPALREYLEKILLQTETETEHVHLPEMKKLGITEADIKIAFTILNARYIRNKPTIISSEWDLVDQLLEADEGVFSRVYERCKNHMVIIMR